MNEETEEGKSATSILFRYRSPTFSKEEVETLLNIVDRYKYTLFNKSTNSSANQAKDLCWEKVAEIFNSKGFEHERSVDSLKTKWDNLKRDVRKHSANLIDESFSGYNDVSRQILAMAYEVENNAPPEGQNLDGDEFHELVSNNDKSKANLKRKHSWEKLEEKESDESNDGDHDKRSYRSPRFSRQEVETLFNLVERYKYTILNKATSAIVNRSKDLCWEKIAKIFNSKGFKCERSVDNLKTKWENLKRNRKKTSDPIEENNGGGNDLSKQIAAMVAEVENSAPAEGQNLDDGDDDDDEFNDGDDDNDKRNNRSLNFTPQECTLLLECVRNEKNLVFSKEHNAHAIGLKNKAWKRITNAFNKKSPQKRSPKVLRTKFNNLKGMAKSMGIKDAVKSYHRNNVKHEKLVNESVRVVKSEPMFEVELELENGQDFDHHNSDSDHFAPDPLSTVLNSDSGIGSTRSSSWSQENKEVVKLKLELLNYKMETARLERLRLEEASRAGAAAREERAVTSALELRAARLRAVAAAAALPRDHPALIFTMEELPAERYLRQYQQT